MIKKEHDRLLYPGALTDAITTLKYFQDPPVYHRPLAEKKYMIRVPKAYIDSLPKYPKENIPFPLPQILADWGRWSGLYVYDDPEYPECVQVEVTEETYLAMEADLKKADKENACSK